VVGFGGGYGLFVFIFMVLVFFFFFSNFFLFLGGVPAGYNNNFQIVQTKDHVAIFVEQIHDVRSFRSMSRRTCRRTSASAG